MSKATQKLIKIVEKKAGEQHSWSEAQQLLQKGADVKAFTKSGPMIDSVIAEEKQYRSRGILWKADNCQYLIQVLQKDACNRLSEQVFSANGGDINEMHELVRIGASCYQSERYGPLGLLGSLLNQETIHIRLDVVRVLIEGDPNAQYAWTTVDAEQKTCMSLAKNNSKCPQNVKEYIQRQFDMVLNQIPLKQPQINPSEVVACIRRGANIEATDDKRNTILSNAVIANNLELVRVLVANGSNTAHKNNDGLTPFQIAKKAALKNPPLITILEKQSVNVELKQLIETKKSHLTTDEVRNFLENGADINATFSNNNSLLHILIFNDGTPEMITAFVQDFNADISATNTNGFRPIETCVKLDEDPFVRLLAFFKLAKMTNDLFINTKLDKTLLQFAIEQRRSGAAKIIQDELNIRLWNCLTRTNTKDEHNKTILDEAKQLIACGAQINYKHRDNVYHKWTVLHLACKTTTKLVVQYIIELLKADYTLQNHNGDYPIGIAAEYGHLLIVEYLHGLPNLSLNVSNKEQQTPLHLATKNHHLLVVRYLVKWGADHQAQNLSRQTPLNVAHANISKTKEEEINDKKLIQFLEQLICPPVDRPLKQVISARKPNYDLDTCELVAPVEIKPIQMITNDVEAERGNKNRGFLLGCPNDNLHDAAKDGALLVAQQAIANGADIRHRKGNRTPYEVAQISEKEYTIKLNSPTLTLENRSRLQNMVVGCQNIAGFIRQIAQTKVLDAIDQSSAGHLVAYHLAGAILTTDLLYRACNASDNVEIVDYLINQNTDMYQAMINYSSPHSLYQIAKKKKNNRVATYLKYRLSIECTKSIKENNLPLVNKLVRNGASVDMHNTNNIEEALKHQNAEMIQLLCQNGAKLPSDWLTAKTIILPPAVSQQLKTEIKHHINQCLIERRLRFAAASGDLNCLIQCQRLGADINAANCHGSTALFCTIQYGNYFPIVHALVSCGASMLNSNEDEPISLIDLAKQQNYKQIADYLSNELNVQFLSAILNNDRQSAEKFSKLGADFNCQDEQKRTALHYAVQFHGKDLVTWLCDCGSNPTTSDINGDYPLILATEKGDFAIVELFVTKYPATKRQTNKAGLTALQIAQKLKYKRIAELIETGKASLESSTDKDTKPDEPNHSYETLIEAARNGHAKIIKEFIEQRYESKEAKRKLCYELIQLAKKYNQFQILSILEPYYNTKLKTELSSDMEVGSVVTLSDHYKKVLLGFLSGISSIIADSSVVLDPTDPNTYRDLFSDLTSNVTKRSQQLQQVNNEQDVKKLTEQDSINTKQQLAKINEQLEQLFESKESMQSHIEDAEEQLFKIRDLTAIQKKQFIQDRETHKKQLATIESYILLVQRQQEATLIKQNTLNFIKGNNNLAMFYRTIENRLDTLFISIAAAQGGYVKRETTAVNSMAANIPFVNILVSSIKSALSPVLSKLNEKEQKQEWHNISTLGNIEELKRIASDTAGIVTLYYKEQIQSIDPFQKIRGSNVFNDKVKWVKDIFYDVRPERSEEKAIVMVAEYVTAWIIDALKEGKHQIIPTEPLPQQLWLHVATKNPADQGTNMKVSDVVGLSAGQERIPLKFRNTFGKETWEHVQLRHLIGCVSVLGNDGKIYQYPISKRSLDSELDNLEIFGYVYVTPFTSNEKAFQSIIDGRKLNLAKYDEHGNILTRFEDIIEPAKYYGTRNDEYVNNSSITKETANQVAEVLRQQKIFLDSKDVKDELKKAQETIELSIDVLREDIQGKTVYYQTSIDAAHEQIKQESIINRDTMKKDNEMHYDQAWKKLNEKFNDVEKHLNQRIDIRMNDIQQEMREEIKQIRAVVETARIQSLQAIAEANQATQMSHKSAQQAEHAAISAQNLTESIEQRRKELQVTTNNCENTVKQTAAAQKEFYERTILEMRTKFERDVERAKEATHESADSAKESARAAQESVSSARDVQKTTKNQLDLQKRETDKTLAEVRETRQQSERAVGEAREAEKQAKRAADTGTAALEKVNNMYEKVEKALERIEKLTKRLQ